MVKIRLMSNSERATIYKDEDEDNGYCYLCGEDITGDFVRFIVRTGEKSSKCIDIHKKHFTDEAIKIINKEIGKRVAEEI